MASSYDMAEYQFWQKELKEHNDFKELTKLRENHPWIVDCRNRSNIRCKHIAGLQAIFESSFSKKQVEKGTTFVLVVDQTTFKIISSALEHLELIKMGCAGIRVIMDVLISSLASSIWNHWRMTDYSNYWQIAVVHTIGGSNEVNTRVPQPSLDAIYFVEPAKETLERISQVHKLWSPCSDLHSLIPHEPGLLYRLRRNLELLCWVGICFWRHYDFYQGPHNKFLIFFEIDVAAFRENYKWQQICTNLHLCSSLKVRALANCLPVVPFLGLENNLHIFVI